MSFIFLNLSSNIIGHERSPGMDHLALSGEFFTKNRQDLLPSLPVIVPSLSRGPPIHPPYTLFVNAGNYRRKDFSDQYGNVRGEYSYISNSDVPRSTISLPLSKLVFHIPGEITKKIPFFPIPKHPLLFTPSPFLYNNHETKNSPTKVTQENGELTLVADTTLSTTTEYENPLSEKPDEEN